MDDTVFLCWLAQNTALEKLKVIKLFTAGALKVCCGVPCTLLVPLYASLSLPLSILLPIQVSGEPCWMPQAWRHNS